MSAPALGGQSGNPISRDKREGPPAVHKRRTNRTNATGESPSERERSRPVSQDGDRGGVSQAGR
jgi:hypothetical protein